jgi:hypothetical protein
MVEWLASQYGWTVTYVPLNMSDIQTGREGYTYSVGKQLQAGLADMSFYCARKTTASTRRTRWLLPSRISTAFCHSMA